MYISTRGNEGRKLIKYGVNYRDRVKGITQRGPKINLEAVLMLPGVRDHYPHNIGLFEDSSRWDSNWKPKYIKTQVVQNQEELLAWISQELDMKRNKCDEKK